MRHFEEIANFTRHLYRSERCHSLIVLGPPGWGKSCTIRQALGELGVEYKILGAYSTPLALFNALCESSNSTIVLDDTAGLLSSPQSLAILAAAVWPGSESRGTRLVRWSSTSEKAITSEVEFNGKIIILTNAIPSTHAALALCSRSLKYEIIVEAEQVPQLLMEAAESTMNVPEKETAMQVARFLGERVSQYDASKFNLRTLEQGIDFAVHSPESWQQMLLAVLPKRSETKNPGLAKNKRQFDIILDLDRSNLRVHEQVAQFERLTGQKRRTFFTLRRQLGLSKPKIVAPQVS